MRRIGQLRATLGRKRDKEKGKHVLEDAVIQANLAEFKDKQHVDDVGVVVRWCEKVWACGRVGVWACGRVGVWACGRAGVLAFGKNVTWHIARG